jgi:hypothetical protein
MNRKTAYRSFVNIMGVFIVSSLLVPINVLSQDSADTEALAKELANPIASLISVPFQFNYDSDIGLEDNGDRLFVNIQPVCPIALNDKWNIISRTILPVITQDDIFAGAGDQSGLGDIVQSAFLSPGTKTSGGWTLGLGPVLLIPTATDDLLGSKKWGVGPTAVALKQSGPWTYGFLGNHIWSVAGDSDRSDISTTFMQPFMTYTTKSAVSYVLITESTYDWKAEQWAIPINVLISKVVKIGKQTISFGAGVRYWAESADSGPEGFGARAVFTMLFPK